MFALRDLIERHLDELSGIVADEHGKVLSDAQGEVIRGLEVVEFACRHPDPAEGRVLRAGLDRRGRLLVPPAARRLRRDHPVQLPGHGADVDAPDRDRHREHLRPQAERARPVGVQLRSPGCTPRPGLPDGVFNVVHGDKVAVDAILDHPGIAAVSLRRLHADRQVRAPARVRPAASGCRRSAARRTTPSCCRTPTSSSPRTTSPRPDTDRPGSAAWPSPRSSPWATRATPWWPGFATRPGEVKVGPGRDQASEMGPVVTPEAKDRIVGYVDRGITAGATLVVDGRGLTVTGHEGGFFVGPTPVRPRHHRHGHLHRRDLRPGPGRPAGRDASTRRSTSSTPTRTATAPRSSPPAARPPATSSGTSRSG